MIYRFRIGLIHKWSLDSRSPKWSVHVSILPSNCKQSITSLSLLVGTTAVSKSMDPDKSCGKYCTCISYMCFNIYQHEKFNAQLGLAWKKFYNLRVSFRNCQTRKITKHYITKRGRETNPCSQWGAVFSIAICRQSDDKWQSKILFERFWSMLIDSINVLDCRLPGVITKPSSPTEACSEHAEIRFSFYTV